MEELGITWMERQWEAYHAEIEAIQKRLKRDIPDGKRGALNFRLSDIQSRLLPAVCQRMQY